MKGIWIFTCLGKVLELHEPRFWPARQHLGCPRAWGPHRFRGPTVSSHGDCIHSGAACPGWTAPAKRRIQNVSSTDEIILAFWNVFMLDKNHVIIKCPTVHTLSGSQCIHKYKSFCKLLCLVISHLKFSQGSNCSFIYCYLWHQVELHHCIGQGFSVGFQTGHQPEHGPVECSVNLGQWNLSRIIHIHHRDVSQESTTPQQDN